MSNLLYHSSYQSAQIYQWIHIIKNFLHYLAQTKIRRCLYPTVNAGVTSTELITQNEIHYD